MRILFMGTPNFARESLDALYKAGYDICAVMTRSDKPKNRGMRLTPPPVKELALAHGTPVYQPKTLRDGEAFTLIQDLDPDLIVVVAYAKILPQEILDLPPYGCINVHPSLLPKYRGAAPIQCAVLNGEETTGVTIMQMDAGLDTGDVITQRETEILPNETSGELFERLCIVGTELLVETIQMVIDGTATYTPQDSSLSSYAKPITRDMSPVDFTRTATQITNQIRGLNPWPTATVTIKDRAFKLLAAQTGEGKGDPGEVLQAGKNGLEIACGEGSVYITKLQAPGKKPMSAADYLRGNPIE